MENNLDLSGGGLVCDNPKCDWEDMSIKIEDYHQYVNMACPKCGENILTEEDFNNVNNLIKAVNMTKSMTPEQMDELIKNLTPEQMDQALDKFNEMGFTKVSDNEDGTSNFSSKHPKHK